MSDFSLSRNAKFYVAKAGDTTNCYQIPILAGFSFTQTTATQEISVNESGEAPIRGQKGYNTALNPVDVSFSTYARPFNYSGASANSPDAIQLNTDPVATDNSAVESILWMAAAASKANFAAADSMDTVGTVTVGQTDGTPSYYTTYEFADSDAHELGQLDLYFDLEGTIYKIGEFTIGSVSVDFAIDSITTLAWAGQGSTLTSTGVTLPTNQRDINDIDEPSFIKNKLTYTEFEKLSEGELTNAAVNVSDVDLTITGVIDSAILNLHSVYGTNEVMLTVYRNDTLETIHEATSAPRVPSQDFPVRTVSHSGETLVVKVVGDASAVADITYYTDHYNTYAAVTEPRHTNSTTAEANAFDDNFPNPYEIAVTGGSIELANNITFLTPEQLGVLNKPIGSFTGVRSVTGNVTAYLKATSGQTKDLYDAIVEDVENISPRGALRVYVGGKAEAGDVRDSMYLNMGTCKLTVPDIAIDDLVTVTINFIGEGQEGIEDNNELAVGYSSAVGSSTTWEA